VLALLPTATDNIFQELQTERISFELQQQKAAKLARNGEPHPSELGSGPPSVTDDDGRSMASLHSESGIHASHMGIPSASATGDGPQNGGQNVLRSKKSKVQLWTDLKYSGQLNESEVLWAAYTDNLTAITRAFTLIYTLALLTLLTRIQLNLLGRRSYLSSVVSLATGGMEQSTISLENHDDDNPDQAYGNDFETNRRYLTFSWWLLHRGWREIMLKVEAAVKEVFGGVSIREDMTIQRFSELTLDVRKKIEGATEADRMESKWLQCMLPPKDQEILVLKESGVGLDSGDSLENIVGKGTPLRRLLDETSDLIDSPPFASVLTLLLDAGFSTLVDQKLSQQAFKVPAAPAVPDMEAPRITEVFEPKPVKLPIILALLTRQAHSIGNGVPNEYLQAMEQVQNLEAFAAVVYSSNWESEISPIDETKEEDLTEQGFVLLDASPEVIQINRNNIPTSPKETEEVLSSGPNEDDEAGQISLVDVAAESTFEKAWGEATAEKKAPA
jgi:peroxin-3